METTFVTRLKRASLALRIVGIAQAVAVFQMTPQGVMTLWSLRVSVLRTSIAATSLGVSNAQAMPTSVEVVLEIAARIIAAVSLTVLGPKTGSTK